MRSAFSSLVAILFLLVGFLSTAGASDEGLTLHRDELPNGLQVVVIEKPSVPLVTVEIVVRTGAFTETAETDGLAHLYEHMFFKGNKKLPTQEAYMRRVTELGIQFNGTTSNEKVNYFITLPAANFAGGMEFMANAIKYPLFKLEELKKERKVVIGEYDRNEANPMHHLWRAIGHGMYDPYYYRKNALGERDVILSATPEQMRNFKETYYVPNNSLLLIVGDVNRTEALAAARRHLGDWKRGPDPFEKNPIRPLPHLQESKHLIVNQPVPYIAMQATWHGPDVGKDDRATYVADAVGTMLGLPNSRFQKAFTDSGLCSSASLGYYTQAHGGEIHFSAQLTGTKLYETRDLLFEQIEAMGTPGYFTAEELALAKKNLRMSHLYTQESGADFAHTIGFWWATAGMSYYENYLDAIDSVTLEECRAFIRRYLQGKPYVMGVLTNKKNQKELKLTPDSLAPDKEPIPVAVEEFELSNGLRVLFKKDTASRFTAGSLLVDGGATQLTEETQGAELLALRAALKGSDEYSKEEIRGRLAELGAGLNVDGNYDHTTITAKGPNEAFGELLNILSHSLRSPLLEEKEIELLKAQTKKGLEAEESNPDNRIWHLVNELFFAAHPYRHRPKGTPETVAKLGLSELQQALERVRNANRLLLVVVGNQEPKKLKNLLEDRLGWIPSRKWNTPPETPFVPGNHLVTSETKEIPTAYVVAKFPAPAPGDEDYAAMRVGMTILSRTFWQTIRTKHALSYAPFAGLSIYSNNYGYLYVSSVKPVKCRELMLEDIRKMLETSIDETRVQGTAMKLLTRSYMQAEKVEALAEQLGRAELKSGGWETVYRTLTAMRKLTPEEVQRAMKKYLKNFRWGIIGPESMVGQFKESVVGGK